MIFSQDVVYMTTAQIVVDKLRKCWLLIGCGMFALGACSNNVETFTVGEVRFCVPEENVLRANVMWLPGYLPSSGGFNFQTDLSADTNWKATGAVMPRGYYRAFPRPGNDSIFVAELKSVKASEYAIVGNYIALGNSDSTVFVRIWDRKSFEARIANGAAAVPELIASCQRFEIGLDRRISILCERAVRESAYDLAWSFPYEELKNLALIEESLKERVKRWQCNK